MEAEKTHSYTYFWIESNGEIVNGIGLVGNEGGIFDPQEITDLLGVEPFRAYKKGDMRKGGTPYLASSWSAEKSSKNRLDVEAQCMEIIKRLKPKVHLINQIREKYDINCGITIVPHIYGEESPIMSFNREIIEFCYQVNATIEVDMYVYQDE